MQTFEVISDKFNTESNKLFLKQIIIKIIIVITF